MGKPIPCKVICNTRWGYCMTPQEFPSIRQGIKYGRESGLFAYRVFVNNKVVRRGFGQED